MEKLTAFAEKYLEWVVLAVAGVFVLLMVWLYVLNNPTTAELGNESVRPGEVDKTLLDGNATRLKSAINNPRVIDIPPQDVLAAIADEFSKEDDTFPQVASNTVPNRGADFELPTTPDGGELPQDDNGGVFIAELPELPSAEVQLAYAGKAKVGVFALEELDAQPPVLNPEDATDTTWVKVVYEIPLAQLRTAWQSAALPNIAKQTVFLDAHLVREVKLANGAWGNTTDIARLKTVYLPEEPPVGNKSQEKIFRDYMAEIQPEIVMEPFYEFFEGEDPRFEPLSEEEQGVDGLAQPGGGFNPQDFLEGRIPADLTPEQREQVLQARREEAQRRQREGDRPGGPPGGEFGGYGEFGGGEFGPNSGATLPIAQPAPRGRGNNRGNNQGNNQGSLDPFSEFGGYGGEFGQYGEFGGYDEFGMGNDPRGQRRGDQENGYAPRSFFNPLDDKDLVANVRGWLYDITAEPGKVYRYKVVYALQNPLWSYDPAEVPQDKLALLDPLQLVSDQANTTWSEEIEVAPDTYLFLAREIRGNDNSPQFTIFRWQNGVFNEASFTASPGDPIGSEKDGVDYRTGWILADVRQDPTNNQRVAVLVHRDGRVQIRGTADLSDEQVEELRAQVQEVAVTP